MPRRPFLDRFSDWYWDPISSLPRSRVRAVLDFFPALWFALFGKED